jgi:hypothetical protein
MRSRMKIGNGSCFGGGEIIFEMESGRLAWPQSAV